MSEQMKKEFDDFMQDMYDEEELQYMDSGFVDALQSAFSNGWQASRQSLVVKLPELFNATFCDAYEADAMKEVLDDAGVRYE